MYKREIQSMIVNLLLINLKLKLKIDAREDSHACALKHRDASSSNSSARRS